MPVLDRDALRAVGDAVDRAGQRHHGERIERVTRRARRPPARHPASAANSARVEPDRVRLLRRPATVAYAARASERSMNTGSSTQGMPSLARDLRAPPRSPSRRSASNVPRLTSSASARATNAPISSAAERHRGNRARRKQRVRREGLRDRIGDAMHARAARAQTHQDVGCDVRKLGPHLSSLRRHDPDQVRWVGERLSARRSAGHPIEIATGT